MPSGQAHLQNSKAEIKRLTGTAEAKTFPDEKLAKQWLAEQERNALLRIHFKIPLGAAQTHISKTYLAVESPF